MATSAEIAKGIVLKLNGENYLVLDYDHVQTGRGGAYYQTKLKSLRTGKIIENRFRSGETIELAKISRTNYQYLYREADLFFFMNLNTFEQIPVPMELIGEGVEFLKENQDVQVAFENDEVLSVDVPLHVNLRIIHTEPGLKGDTATNVLKPATLETGAIIQVPLFANEGDLIRVDTRQKSYIERVKE